MPTNQEVSVAWQIVFTFIPIVNLWAFYRIRKLRMYVLYVVIPAIVVSVIITTIYAYIIFEPLIDRTMNAKSHKLASSNNTSFIYETVSPELWPGESRMTSWSMVGASSAFQALSIYLIIIWSRQRNRQFDQPTTQQTGP
jgi:hypothetical protein